MTLLAVLSWNIYYFLQKTEAFWGWSSLGIIHVDIPPIGACPS